MKEGAKDTAVVFSSRLAVPLVGFAIQSVFAWLLGPERQGRHAVCLTSGLILVSSFRRATGQSRSETWSFRREDMVLLY